MSADARKQLENLRFVGRFPSPFRKKLTGRPDSAMITSERRPARAAEERRARDASIFSTAPGGEPPVLRPGAPHHHAPAPPSLFGRLRPVGGAVFGRFGREVTLGGADAPYFDAPHRPGQRPAEPGGGDGVVHLPEWPDVHAGIPGLGRQCGGAVRQRGDLVRLFPPGHDRRKADAPVRPVHAHPGAAVLHGPAVCAGVLPPTAQPVPDPPAAWGWGWSSAPP